MKRHGHDLRLYIQYEHLTANDLAELLQDLDGLYRMVGQRMPESEGYFLSVASVHTGHSIEIKFSDGWIPSLSKTRGGKFVLKVHPSFIVGWLLIGAHNALIDGVLKERDLWAGRPVPAQIIKEFEQPQSPIRDKASAIVGRILGNKRFTQVEINKLKLKVEIAAPAPEIVPVLPKLFEKRVPIVLAPNLTERQFVSLAKHLEAKGIRIVRTLDKGAGLPEVIIMEMHADINPELLKELKRSFPQTPVLVIARTPVSQIARMVEGAIPR